MASWLTIWDHEFAAFGKRRMTFAGSSGTYFVDVDEQNQDQILVTYESGPLPWEILRKSVLDGVFRLEGTTWGHGDPYDDGGGWFELTLRTPAAMRLWGNQVIAQEDNEIGAGATIK